jgi:hypothetical protein
MLPLLGVVLIAGCSVNINPAAQSPVDSGWLLIELCGGAGSVDSRGGEPMLRQ